MRKFQQRTIQLFSSRFRGKKNASLQKTLLAARMYMPSERWQSLTLYYSIVCNILVIFLLILMKIVISIKYDWRRLQNIPETILHYKEYYFVGPSFKFEFGLLDFLLVVLVSIITFSVVYSALYFYPDIKAWERERKINALLPSAIGYISSMAKMGIVPYEIFKTLAGAKESFKEVSVEAMVVVRNVEVLGMDLIAAIRDLASTTPSSNLRVFLQGAVMSVTSGGDIGTYFINKSRQYMEEKRGKYADYISMLGIISEVYITAMVATPIVVIVMFLSLAMIGGASPTILYVIIYVFIPVGSFIFLLLIDSISPEKG